MQGSKVAKFDDDIIEPDHIIFPFFKPGSAGHLPVLPLNSVSILIWRAVFAARQMDSGSGFYQPAAWVSVAQSRLSQSGSFTAAEASAQ